MLVSTFLEAFTVNDAMMHFLSSLVRQTALLMFQPRHRQAEARGSL